MNLEDALHDNQLNEMALSNVNSQIMKMLQQKDYDRLANVLAGVAPEQVVGWSQAEKQQFLQFQNNPGVKKAIANNTDAANAVNGISKKLQAEPEETPAAAVPAATQPQKGTMGAVGVSPELKKQIDPMQKQWFAAPDKNALIAQWTADQKSSTARLYNAGKRSGYFKAPAAKAQ